MLIILNHIVNHLKTHIHLINNEIQWRKIIKSQINSELLKNYTKNGPVLVGRFSIFADESRKSAKFSDYTTPDNPQNEPKMTFFEAIKQEKYNFILLWYSELQRKWRKSLKKCAGCAVCVRKILFLQSQTTTTWGERKEGLSTGDCSLKRMEECSKYSSKGIWDSQAMKSGQTI